KCVLCQQDLDEAARQRLKGFNQFVLNDISTQLNMIKQEIEQKLAIYQQLTFPAFENMAELEAVIPQFRARYDAFILSLTESRDSISNYLHNGNNLNVNLQQASAFSSVLIHTIASPIEQHTLVMNDRNLLGAEHKELARKEFLGHNRLTRIKYCNEYRYKKCDNRWQGYLSTMAGSKKIG